MNDGKNLEVAKQSGLSEGAGGGKQGIVPSDDLALESLGGLAGDTLLSAELAALYLRLAPAELAEIHKPKHSGGRIDKNARTQAAPVSYSLKTLRDLQKTVAPSPSIDALAKAGTLGWMTVKLPFFAELEPRIKRGRRVLIGNAWDSSHPEREARFAGLVNGRIRITWITSLDAAISLWSDAANHRVFAARGLALYAADACAIEASIVQSEALTSIPTRERTDGV